MEQRNWPLVIGMLIALGGPLCASYFALVLFYFGTLKVAAFALILWIGYFYIAWLLGTRAHDERFVQTCVLILSILMLPWSIVLIFTYFASATKAHNLRTPAKIPEQD